jgi:hypothetical protein
MRERRYHVLTDEKKHCEKAVKLKSTIAPSHTTNHARIEPAGQRSYPKSVAFTSSTPDGKTISKGASIAFVFSTY